ncbi:MAG: hypothetical protein E5299_00826 [Burkholderia gladioli]|nr:MAG: hypothetical protein E5299_00826 [Burkholderia gladioli]
MPESAHRRINTGDHVWVWRCADSGITWREDRLSTDVARPARFHQSLRDLAFPSLPVPNYTTLCRRAKTLDVELPIFYDNEPIHLVVDSTGLKVYGEGDWKVRQHGYSKRRTWRKIHCALNANTGQVHAALMTNQNVADGDALAKLLDQMPREKQINVIGGDGAYDTKPCHVAIAARSAIPSIPPREGGAHWPADLPGAAWRNGAVDAIARDGRREWKPHSGYHRRSLAENAMYRFKALTGNCLLARHIDSQATAVSVRVGVINQYGAPRSSAIRSYRLTLCQSMLLHLHTRFMQQGHIDHELRINNRRLASTVARKPLLALARLMQQHWFDADTWGVGLYLASWGFTPQKPMKQAYEQRPEAVQAWLNETYPEIRAGPPIAEGAEIQWGDERGAALGRCDCVLTLDLCRLVERHAIGDTRPHPRVLFARSFTTGNKGSISFHTFSSMIGTSILGLQVSSVYKVSQIAGKVNASPLTGNLNWPLTCQPKSDDKNQAKARKTDRREGHE